MHSCNRLYEIPQFLFIFSSLLVFLNFRSFSSFPSTGWVPGVGDLYYTHNCPGYQLITTPLITPDHVTKELCAWLITHYTFHAHCCMIYQRTITQDADVFWEDENFIKFPSKIVRFLSFFMKSKTSTPFFLFRYFEVFKIDFNICENQKNE